MSLPRPWMPMERNFYKSSFQVNLVVQQGLARINSLSHYQIVWSYGVLQNLHPKKMCLIYDYRNFLLLCRCNLPDRSFKSLQNSGPASCFHFNLLFEDQWGRRHRFSFSFKGIRFTYFKLENFVATLFIVIKNDCFYLREGERSHWSQKKMGLGFL